MKLLLTSAGIKNTSIHDALVELLGKPIAESDALCVPTALYGHPMAGPRQAWRCISGQETGTPTVGLGWKTVGVLELTALPSLDEERWVPLVRETDVLLVEGEARLLRAWDFFHSPPWTEHAFVGADDAPSVVLMVGAHVSPDVRYPVSDLAARYGAGVAKETSDPEQVYATAERFRRERPPYWPRLPWG